MSEFSPLIARRSLLRWAGAAAGAACSGSLSAAAAQPAPPEGRLRDYLLMRGALDDRLVIGTLSGEYYGVLDEEITPLFGVLAVTFTRWRPLPDGRWLSAAFEHAYYTDLSSGEVLDEWRNPLNDKLCKVPVWTSHPATRVLHADLSRHSPKPLPPGFSAEDQVSAMREEAGELIVIQRVRSAAQRPAPARPYRYSELVTLRAPLQALRAPGVLQVPSSTTFAAVSSWRPWQLMGDQPGHLLAHGAGRYGTRIEQLAAVWLAATRRLNPSWWSDPGRHVDAAF